MISLHSGASEAAMVEGDVFGKLSERKEDEVVGGMVIYIGFVRDGTAKRD